MPTLVTVGPVCTYTRHDKIKKIKIYFIKTEVLSDVLNFDVINEVDKISAPGHLE